MRTFGVYSFSNSPIRHTAVFTEAMFPFHTQDLLVLLEVCTFIHFPRTFNLMYHSEERVLNKSSPAKIQIKKKKKKKWLDASKIQQKNVKEQKNRGEKKLYKMFLD